MNIGELIIQEGEKAGLSSDVISRILETATRKLPGNVPEEKWKEQVMEWIDNAANKQRDEAMAEEINQENNAFDTSILGGQAPQPEFSNNSSVTFNNFGEIVREDIGEKTR